MKKNKVKYLVGVLVLPLFVGGWASSTLASETTKGSENQKYVKSEQVTNLEDLFAKPQGVTRITGNTLSITPGGKYEKGAIWTEKKIDFKKSWTLKTQLQVNGDGVVIGFQSKSNMWLGSDGGGLGVYSYADTSAPKGIFVEWDIFDNTNGTASNAKNYPQLNDSHANEFNILSKYDEGQYNLTNQKEPPTKEDTATFEQNGVYHSTIQWDVATNTLSATIDGKGLKATYSNEQLVKLLGEDKKTYLGYAGATGQWALGESFVTFESFSYDNYAPSSKMSFMHDNNGRPAALVTEENPVHKNEKIHVQETISNALAVSDVFSVNYTLSGFNNLDKTSLSDFKVNGVSTTYTDGMLLEGLSNATPIVVNYTINTKQKPGIFFDTPIGLAQPKISVSSVVTSELKGELTTVTQGATVNDAPIISSASNFTVDFGTVLTDERCQTNAQLSYSDTEDALDELKVEVDSSRVNTKVAGDYALIFRIIDADGKSSIAKKVTVTVAPKILSELTVKFVDRDNQVIDVVSPLTVKGTFTVGEKYPLVNQTEIEEQIRVIEDTMYRKVIRVEHEEEYSIPEDGVITYLVAPQEKTPITIKFIDKNNQQVGELLTMPDQIVGSKIDIFDYAPFKERYTAYKNGYYMVNFDREYTIRPNMEIEVVLTGMLVFKSAPSLDFKSIFYSVDTQRITNPSVSNKLEIVNTHANKKAWTLTAKTTKELTNGTSVIKGGLIYKSPVNGQEQSLSEGALIRNQISGEGAVISDSWGGLEDSGGIKLDIDAHVNTIVQGNYSGVIQWTLSQVK